MAHRFRPARFVGDLKPQAVAHKLRNRPLLIQILIDQFGLTGPRLLAIRFPLVAAFVLMIIPMPMLSGGRGRFGSLFVLTPIQLVLVAAAAIWAGIAVVAMIQMAHRSIGQPIPAMTPHRWAVAVGILSAPILVRSIVDSSGGLSFPLFLLQILYVIGGAVITAVSTILASRRLRESLPNWERALHRSFVKNPKSWLERMKNIAFDNLAALCSHAQDDTLLRGFLAMVAIVYVAGAIIRPSGNIVPALAYLLLMFSLVAALISMLAAFVDQYRVPVLLCLGLFLGAIWYVWPARHHFQIEALSARPALMTPQDVASRGKGPAVLLVAGGGGMRAAVWEIAVVEQLQQACGNFLPSVEFVSAVSGGSVGAMYLFDTLDKNRGATPQQLQAAFDRASRSSLQQLAWALTYPNFARPPWVDKPLRDGDMAEALEVSWQRDWQWQRQRLSGWRKGLADHALPAVSMNAVVEETGTPLMFTNFDVPEEQWTHERIQRYQRQLETSDMDIVTAARLSATFPFVTPMAQPSIAAYGTYRVADGGYFDNSGLYVMMKWIQETVDTYKNQGRPIVVVEIASTSNPEHPDPNRRSLTAALVPPVITPVTTMFNSQAATEEVRNWLMHQAISEQAKDKEVPVYWSSFTLFDVPASWEMTHAQLKGVRNEARDEKHRKDIERVTALTCPTSGVKAVRMP